MLPYALNDDDNEIMNLNEYFMNLNEFSKKNFMMNSSMSNFDNITFEQLIQEFEENNLELSQVPQQFVDKYGYACLANSLMFKEHKIPKFNPEIVEYIKSHSFETLESLISYIKEQKNDIDKLYAIFSYAALNIEYDIEMYFSKKLKKQTLEDVFSTKKAVCSGYSLFYSELSKKVGINTKRIKIKEYSNLAKGFGYDPLQPPSEIKSNHASIYVSIDGIPFISEPTWGAGHISKDHKFHWNFAPYYFLIPIYKSLNTHYPCDESKELLQLDFSFPHFSQSIRVDNYEKNIKTETNPFVNTDCSSGYLEQTYSCIGPIESINFDIYKQKDNAFNKINIDGITSYQIIQKKLPKHPKRCRFRTFISFPEAGFYKIELFINTKYVLEHFVNALRKSENSVPIQYNSFDNKYKFIPICPTQKLTKVENSAMIRFCVNKKVSNLLYDIIKLKSENKFDHEGEKIERTKYAKWMKLKVPFDKNRYEDQICVTFPANGRYCVQVFLQSGENGLSFTSFVEYFFDVVGVTTDCVKVPRHPIFHMFEGRTIAPLNFSDENGNKITVKPNKSCIFVKIRSQKLRIKTNSVNDEIHFELRCNERPIDWPEPQFIGDGFHQVRFTIPPEYGEYSLEGWVNKRFCISITYIYEEGLNLRKPYENENDLMNKLRENVCREINDDKIEDMETESENEEKEILNNEEEQSENDIVRNNNNNESDDDESSDDEVDNEGPFIMDIVAETVHNAYNTGARFISENFVPFIVDRAVPFIVDEAIPYITNEAIPAVVEGVRDIPHNRPNLRDFCGVFCRFMSRYVFS